MIDILKAMEKVGSKSLVGAMYSYWPCQFEITDKEAAWERSIEGMKEVAEAAESLGIECCQEVLNRYETYIITDCREGLEYCRRVGSENVNLLLDTFHMNIEEDNIPEAIRLAGRKLGHLHVGESNRKLPGMGSLPWRDIGRALRDIGYEKGVVMEPFLLQGGEVARDCKVWRDLSGNADEKMLDRYIKESLTFLKHEFTFLRRGYEMAEIWTMGEMIVEIMREKENEPLDKAGVFRGPYPSGAPAIFIDTVARLGHKGGIIGGVGKDDFGKCLLDRLKSDGVDSVACD